MISYRKIFRVQCLLLALSATVFCTTAFAEIKSDVAFGSHFKIGKGDAGGSFARKPFIFLRSSDGKFKSLPVLTRKYPADEIECLFDLKVPAKTYELYVADSKKGVKKLLTDRFYVMAPEFDTDLPESPAWGDAGDKITLKGKYFGNECPKLRIDYYDTTAKKFVSLKCKVLTSKHIMDVETGDSTLQFAVPRKMPDRAVIITLESPSGNVQTAFCSFPFNKQIDIEIPMRDAVTLRGNLYTPVTDGPYPTLIFRTPYDKNEGDAWNERTIRNAVKRGYAVLIQDVRGRFNSDGDYNPYFQERQDGYDTIEWAAAQPWSSGDIGTFGLSYPGGVQWLSAIETPPHLKAMVPAMVPSTFNQCIYFGGVFEIGWTGWTYKYMSPNIRVKKELYGPRTITEATREFEILGGEYGFNSYLPTFDLPYMKDTCDFYYDWLSNPPYSAYYDAIEVRLHYPDVKAAVLNMSGWYDEAYGSEGATTNFLGLLASRAHDADKKTKLIVGPWIHGVDATETAVSGNRKFPENSRIDYDSVVLDWLDYYVRGIQNDVPNWPMVQVYQMEGAGGGQWRTGDTWPLGGTRDTSIYLIPSHTAGGHGTVTWSKPEQSYTDSSFVSNPFDPVKDTAGTVFGAYDLSYISDRTDVLTFDSEPLESDVAVIGQVKAEIYLSSNSKDCDLFVKLIDLAPDGSAFNLNAPGQEVMRISYRDKTSERQLLEPGQIVKLDFENVRTGNVFKKGHRIRVCICASWFPYYSTNLQTGELETTSSAAQKATISIHHDPAHQSRVILPVVEATGQAD